MSMKLASTMCAALLLAGVGCGDDAGKPPPDLGRTDQKPATEAAPKTCGTTTFLPADGKVGDYKRDSAPQVATTAKELADLINGGSVKYEQNKFVCMCKLRSYTSATKNVSIEVWIFDQTDVAGATQAMADSGTPDHKATTTTVGDASDENNALPFGYEARARKGKHLARVYTDKKTDGKDDALALLKEAVAAMP